jgi:hypothetical protein
MTSPSLFWGLYFDPTATRSPIPKDKMTSQTPSSVAERRLAIARRLFNALVAQLPNRLFTLRDGQGRVIASSKPDPDAEDNSA